MHTMGRGWARVTGVAGLQTDHTAKYVVLDGCFVGGYLQHAGTVVTLFCKSYSNDICIPFPMIALSKVLVVNRKSVLACKCAGDTLSSLEMRCGMTDLPPPVSKNTYTGHLHKLTTFQTKSSMNEARMEFKSTMYIECRWNHWYVGQLWWEMAEMWFYITLWSGFRHRSWKRKSCGLHCEIEALIVWDASTGRRTTALKPTKSERKITIAISTNTGSAGTHAHLPEEQPYSPEAA